MVDVSKKHWVMDLRNHGIASSYVKPLIDQCGCQIIQKVNSIDMLGTNVSKYDKTTMPTEMIEVEASKLDDTLAEIQIKYHTCLWRGVSKGKHVTGYDCYRACVPR